MYIDHVRGGCDLGLPGFIFRNLSEVFLIVLSKIKYYFMYMYFFIVLLNANYRSHEELVKYSSKLFYNGQLKACGRQLRHPQLHPLAFLAARGEGKQQHGTGYCNISEVSSTLSFLCSRRYIAIYQLYCHRKPADIFDNI